MNKWLATVFGALVALVVGAVSIWAWNSQQPPVPVQLGEGDWAFNYDFVSNTASQSNVDWPVNLVFWYDADVDKVKGMVWGPAATRY